MKKVFTIITCIAALVVTFFALQKKEYAQVSSPEGTFIAVAEYRAYLSWLPTNPGGSGDKTGWIRIATKEGREIESKSVPMVSMIKDIIWTKEEAPLPGVTSWNLAKQ